MMFKTTYLTRLTDVDTIDREGVGTLRWESGKMYKYVKYEHGTAALDLVIGDVVVYTVEDADSYFVTADVSDITDDNSGLPVMAGVIVAATVTETDRYIWIQIGGPNTLAATVTGTTPASGDRINASLTDKKAKVDPASNEVICGYMVSRTTGIILQCPW